MDKARQLNSSLSLSRLTGLRGRALVRAAVAGPVFLATLGIVAIHEHAPYDIQAGLMAQVLAGTVPLIAAAVAGYAVLRPWPAYLVVLLLTPYWDLAQVSWWVGSLQVIGQTLFLVALGLGCLLDDRVNPASIAAWVRGLRHGGGLTATVRVAGLALAALLLLACLSTARSPDVTESGTVLLHGILEPVAMGIVLLALGPNLRKLALVAVVLGISVGLGGLLNMIQTLPDIRSLSGLQTDRLLLCPPDLLQRWPVRGDAGHGDAAASHGPDRPQALRARSNRGRDRGRGHRRMPGEPIPDVLEERLAGHRRRIGGAGPAGRSGLATACRDRSCRGPALDGCHSRGRLSFSRWRRRSTTPTGA